MKKYLQYKCTTDFVLQLLFETVSDYLQYMKNK